MRWMGVNIQRQLLPTACFSSGLSRHLLSSLSPLPPSCYYFPCLATCTHLPNRTIIDAHKKNARRRRGTNIVVAHKANNNAVMMTLMLMMTRMMMLLIMMRMMIMIMMLMGSNKHNKQPQAQQQQVSQSQPETATATSKGVHTQDTIDNIKCTYIKYKFIYIL